MRCKPCLYILPVILAGAFAIQAIAQPDASTTRTMPREGRGGGMSREGMAERLAQMQEQAREQTRVTLDAFWDGVKKQDAEAIKAVTGDGFLLYTARGNKVSVDRLMEIHKERIPEKNFTFAMRDLKVNGGGRMAWATWDATMGVGDQPWGDFIMTAVLERQEEGWVLVHMHESKQEPQPTNTPTPTPTQAARGVSPAVMQLLGIY